MQTKLITITHTIVDNLILWNICDDLKRYLKIHQLIEQLFIMLIENNPTIISDKKINRNLILSNLSRNRTNRAPCRNTKRVSCILKLVNRLYRRITHTSI